MNLFNKRTLWVAVMGALAAPAAAQEVYLVACPFDQTMPDGMSVRMWGYAQVDATDFNTLTCEQIAVTTPITSPGPAIRVAPDDPSLTVGLKNGLGVPTSLMIPGQAATSAPVFFTDPEGRRRVRSFTHEAAPAGGTATYTWTNLRPGTYAYQSGTHPQVQVQMGLYGAVAKDAVPGEAYPGVAYDSEATLLYSEIDPDLHAAVADGSYGTAAYPSTIDYVPRYFLVNGDPDSANAPGIAAGVPGQRTLLRLINMGLRTHTPVLQNADLALVAEDGNPYPYPRRQYSAMLAAGKTKDAIFSAPAEGQYPLYDRMLDASRGSTSGLVSQLVAGTQPPSATIEAIADDYATDEDTLLTIPAPGVLGNDSGSPSTALLVADVSHGTLALESNGAFTYAPDPDYNGIDSFAYRASDGTDLSSTVLAEITVAAVNDPPVGAPESYSVTAGETLAVSAPGVLGNDTDVEADTLSADLISPATGGNLSLNADGSFSYTPNAGTTSDSFTYAPHDGSAQGAPVTVAIAIQVPTNSPPSAMDDDAQTGLNAAVTIPVLGNDSDPDGADDIDPTTVTITTPVDPVDGTNTSMHGMATVNSDGSITYMPRRNFLGSDVFTYTVNDTAGATSNAASVRVDVLRRVTDPDTGTNNNPPVAVDDFAEALLKDPADTSYQPVVIPVLANDSDTDGSLDPDSVVITIAPLDGTAVNGADGSVIYTPPDSFTGTKTFTYHVSDDQGEPSNEASVTVNVLDAEPTPEPRRPRGRQ